MGSSPRVLVTGTAWDQAQSLAAALQQSTAVAATAVTLDQATACCEHARPDGIVLIVSGDIPAPLATIRRCADHATVLLVGSIPDEVAAEWLLAGARGVLPASATAADVVAMLQQAGDDVVICSDQVTYQLFSQLARLKASRTTDHCLVLTNLSFQEVRILRLLGAGLSNKRIAERANLSLCTVKNYVHRILKQLGLQNRSQAAAYLRALAGGDHPAPGGDRFGRAPDPSSPSSRRQQHPPRVDDHAESPCLQDSE